MPVIWIWDFVSVNKNSRARVWAAGCTGTFIAASMYIYAKMNVPTHSGTSYLDNFSTFVSFDIRIKTALYLMGKSIKLLFIPFPLSSDYSFAQIMPVGTFLTFYSAFAVIIIFCGLMWSWKKPNFNEKSC